MVACLGFLLIASSLSSAAGLNATDQRIFFTEDYDETLGPKEQQCFKQDKFLYEPDGTCYALPTIGPCGCVKERQLYKDMGQDIDCDDNGDRWLVLERQDDGRLHAVCKPCPCCHKTLNVFLKSDGKCHHRTKELRQLCPNNGTELRDNEFGEGECTCVRSPPHARLLGASSGECYPLYRRGPCPQAHVLFPERDPNTLESMARCAPDPCVAHGDGFAQWKEGDGKCYELGSQGPCSKQSKFSIEKITKTPGCVEPTKNIIDPKPLPSSEYTTIDVKKTKRRRNRS